MQDKKNGKMRPGQKKGRQDARQKKWGDETQDNLRGL